MSWDETGIDENRSEFDMTADRAYCQLVPRSKCRELVSKIYVE